MTRGYLLDTNVVSETRKARPAPAVLAWLSAAHPESTWISVLSVGELRRGAASLSGRDDERAAALVAWIDDLEAGFADRIVDVDRRVARAWADLARDRTLPVVDSLLVATAAAHGLALVTRNVRDVAGLGVEVINPWGDA